MTLWICIGVYVVGMAVAPCILSFMDRQLWIERHQSVGDDLGMSITLLLWPVFTGMWLVRMWASFMSEVGEGMRRGLERDLGVLKGEQDD